MTLLMKQAEFAARHNVSAPAVSAWKKRNLLVFVDDPERVGKKLIDVEKSDMLIRGTIDPTRGRPRKAQAEAAEAPALEGAATPTPRAAPQMTGLEAARLEDMRAKVTRRNIENEQLLGRLVPLPEYERRAGDLGRMIRERSHALIRKHAERLSAETDPRMIISLLGDAFDALFGKMADEIEAQANAEQAADAILDEISALDEDDGAGDETP